MDDDKIMDSPFGPITDSDIDGTLIDLLVSGSIEVQVKNGETFYRLTDKGREEARKLIIELESSAPSAPTDGGSE